MVDKNQTVFIVYGSLGVVGKATMFMFEQLGYRTAGIDIKVQESTYPVYDIYNDDLIHVICVPTNLNPKTAILDISIVESIIEEVTSIFGKDSKFIIRSTLPVGTCYKLSKYYKNIVYIPEFLTERTALKDVMNPDRILIGVNTKNNTNTHNQFTIDMYPLFTDLKCKVIINDYVDVELAKLFQNLYAVSKVMFFNIAKIICEDLGGTWEIFKECLVSSKFIEPTHTDVPGPDGKLGYGGKCLPKDSLNIITQFLNNNKTYDPSDIKEVEREEITEAINYYLKDILKLNNLIRKE